MEIKLIPLNQLNPARYNPRKDLKPGDPEYERLKKSMETFGYLEPIIWNKQTGNIVGGHQRLKILEHQGKTKIECVVVDLDETQEKALNIALNKISGEWDLPKLADVIGELDNGIFDITLTGFDAAEIADLFSKVHDKDIEEDNFDIEKELKEPALTQIGDLWVLGEHRLFCGDSTEPKTFDLLMDGKEANLTVTDPPYNVNYEAAAGKIKNDNMKDEAFYEFLFKAFKNIEKVMAIDASIYVFHADTEGLNFRKAFTDAGFYLSGTCIWKKESLVLGRSPYQWQHEPVLFGWKRRGKHNWYSDRKQTTIWEFEKPKKNAEHPIMKPVALIAYPIQNSSLKNSIVLDPFGGSGSTLIACEQTNRICYMVELDEKFCDVIAKRYIEYMGSAENVFLYRSSSKYTYEDIQPHL